MGRVGTSGTRRRLVWSLTTTVWLVVATLAIPSHGDSGAQAVAQAQAQADGYKKAYDARVKSAVSTSLGDPTVFLADGSHLHPGGAGGAGENAPHNHNDPATKNAVSRSATSVDETTADPTSPTQAKAGAAAVAAQRAKPDPELTHVTVGRTRTTVPADKYAMAGGCYAIQSATTGSWLADPVRTGRAATFTAATMAEAAPIHFQATDLGSYLLYGPQADFLARSSGKIRSASSPSPAADWTVEEPKPGQFSLTLPGKHPKSFREAPDGGAIASNSAIGSNGAGLFKLHTTTGCATFPEAEVNVSGPPFAGVSPFQEVRGYVDAHTHGMAFEFLGGRVHCGRPWHPYGVTYALKDCPDHYLTAGKGAVLEDFLSNDFDGHDPVGWPTFRDWPAPASLTHEGTYYKWLERSWRGGLRLFVNLLVENNQLCKIYPLKKNSCNDMDSIRLQAKDMRALERYIDAQNGGPGRGWYRIVTDPEQARQVINAGKLAVVMGIETSVPFGCTVKLGKPRCSKEDIDRQLTEVHKLGVRQMELVNKFDNALAGVAGDPGTTGNLVNVANFLETGTFWDMQHCAVQDPEVHDKDQATIPGNAQDALFGAIVKLNLPTHPIPLYASPHHCNTRGLTDLGSYTIEGMAKRHMIFDPDHMSVKARKTSLDVIERLGYPGVISTHSWSTPDAYPRIYRAGGFITPYAGDSVGFVKKWKRHLTWADPRYYFGFGYGADINGLGAQGDPRPGAAKNPVTYPFKGLGGVTIDKQVSGERVYDINKDGVAHYGLYPDWIEDLRKIAGDDIVKDMSRGPEAYLQMWERAEGVKPNACVNPEQKRSPAAFRALAKSTSTWQVLKKMGQPDVRHGNAYDYCTTTGRAKVTFSNEGRLTNVRVG